MSRLALLIGIEYSNSSDKLPGILVDLYRMYKTLRHLDFDSIVVVTDITEDPVDLTHSDALLNEEVDIGLATFIRSLDRHIILKDKTQLLNIIGDTLGSPPAEVVTETEKILSIATPSESDNNPLGKEIFIFYTGHADDSCSLLLPDGTSIETHELHLLIKTSLTSIDNLFIVFDCCHGNGFNLPFSLLGTRYRYNGKPNWFKSHIVCFCSSTEELTSTATRRGSSATRTLCEFLESSGTLSSLKMRYTTITSTRPGCNLPWSWLRSYKNRVELDGINITFHKKSTLT